MCWKVIKSLNPKIKELNYEEENKKNKKCDKHSN